MLEGQAIRSCVIPVSAAADKNVTTIEGLAKDGKLTKLQQAWIDHQVPQCGFCQSGMLMAATDLLAKNPKPTDADIDTAITNICRCGSFQEVRAAIHSVAKA
jgi:isoquinoline 1-oxidoreductase alpha subunit